MSHQEWSSLSPTLSALKTTVHNILIIACYTNGLLGSSHVHVYSYLLTEDMVDKLEGPKVTKFGLGEVEAYAENSMTRL